MFKTVYQRQLEALELFIDVVRYQTGAVVTIVGITPDVDIFKNYRMILKIVCSEQSLAKPKDVIALIDVKIMNWQLAHCKLSDAIIIPYLLED